MVITHNVYLRGQSAVTTAEHMISKVYRFSLCQDQTLVWFCILVVIVIKVS